MSKNKIKIISIIFTVLITFSATFFWFKKIYTENTKTMAIALDNAIINTNVENTTSKSTIAETSSKSLDENDIDENKKMLILFHKSLLNSFTVANSKIPGMLFSQIYINIFTGEKKDGLNDTYFEDYNKSNNAYKGKSIAQLVSVEKGIVLTYKEVMKEPDKYYVKNKANFNYEEGDYLAVIPRSNSSPLENGWIGIYRKVDGKFKIIAGSF